MNTFKYFAICIPTYINAYLCQYLVEIYVFRNLYPDLNMIAILYYSALFQFVLR